ncbi:MAG: hypothetical protein U0744_21190 [Gemmataceae bacterium]
MSGHPEFVQELEADTGKEIARHQIADWKEAKGVLSAIWSPDEKHIFVANSSRKTMGLLDAKSGALLRTFAPPPDYGYDGNRVASGAFSRNGTRLVTSTNSSLSGLGVIWDVKRTAVESMLVGYCSGARFVQFSPNDDGILSHHRDGDPHWWNVSGAGNRILRYYVPHGISQKGEVYGFAGSVASKLTALHPTEKTLRLVHHDVVRARVAVSENEKRAVGYGEGGEVVVYDLAKGEGERLPLKKIKHSFAIAISPNGRYAAFACVDDGMCLVDLDSRKTLHEWRNDFCTACSFSPDGSKLFLASGANVVKAPHRLIDVESGKTIQTFSTQTERSPAMSVAISRDGKEATISTELHIKSFDLQTGHELRRLTGHSGLAYQVSYSPDSRHLATAGSDGTVRLWEVRTGKELCKLYTLNAGKILTVGGWAVVDSEGRFDASNGGNVEGLHWVINNEPIALGQLKERYYDPGLLAKHLGRSKEPLRKVAALQKVNLYPSANLQEPNADGKLTLKLANRGGGIGKVQVFVNGKELLADARGPGLNAATKEATLVVDLANAPSLKPGQENVVEVVTWNAEGYLSSRGIQRMFTAKGTMQQDAPELHAIVVGVSEYANPSLNLRYSAKDAKRDIASAFDLGAKNCSVPTSRTSPSWSTTRTESTNPDPGQHRKGVRFGEGGEAGGRVRRLPRRPWRGVTRGRGPVLLPHQRRPHRRSRGTQRSGGGEPVCGDRGRSHRVDQEGAGTQASHGARHLRGRGRREEADRMRRSVSGEQIPRHRTASRTAPASTSSWPRFRQSQLRGDAVQPGTADACIAQASGACAARERIRRWGSLFQYAADEVPRLAKNIGGIQKPLIAAPRGSSFDIGRLTTEEKQRVPLASPLPIVLRLLLINPDEGDDNLGLMPRLRQKLADTLQTTKDRPSAVFVDSDEMPGGIRPAGTYLAEKGIVHVRINLRRDGITIATAESSGSAANIDTLADTLCAELLKKLPK